MKEFSCTSNNLETRLFEKMEITAETTSRYTIISNALTRTCRLSFLMSFCQLYPWQIKSLRRYDVISCISHRLRSRVAFVVLNKERKRGKSGKEGKKFSGQFTRERSGSVVSHLDNTLRTTRSRKAHTRTRTPLQEGSVKKGKRRKEKRKEKKRWEGGEGAEVSWKRLEVVELAPRKDRYLNDRVWGGIHWAWNKAPLLGQLFFRAVSPRLLATTHSLEAFSFSFHRCHPRNRNLRQDHRTEGLRAPRAFRQARFPPTRPS